MSVLSKEDKSSRGRKWVKLVGVVNIFYHQTLIKILEYVHWKMIYVLLKMQIAIGVTFTKEQRERKKVRIHEEKDSATM